MNDIEITLSKMCDRFSSGKGINASKIKVNDKYPVFGGNGIRGYTDTYNFDGECAIIGRQGANCGNVIYFKGKGYMTEHAIVACAKSEYSTGYLAYKLKLMNLKQYQGQSAQPGLSVNTLSNIKVNLPKLIIQKKVFNILNLLDSKIELNNKINAELEAMAKTIYDYWFLQFEFPNEEGKPYKSSGGKMVWNEELKREIPEGWETKRLSDIEPNIITGKTPSTKNENYYNGNIPFITISDVRKNMFIVNTEQTLSEEGAKTQEKKYIPEDALCVTCIASPGLVAFSTKLSQTNQQINSIIFEKNYNKLYLYYYLKNYFKYTTGAKTGNTFANMNKEDFSRILVLYPKTKLLTLFQDKTLSLIKLIKKNTIENQELTALRDFLLPLLMNGQVGFKGDKAES